MKRIIVLETSEELDQLIERLARFLGTSPEELVRERCLSNLVNLEEEAHIYLGPKYGRSSS